MSKSKISLCILAFVLATYSLPSMADQQPVEMHGEVRNVFPSDAPGAKDPSLELSSVSTFTRDLNGSTYLGVDSAKIKIRFKPMIDYDHDCVQSVDELAILTNRQSTDHVKNPHLDETAFTYSMAHVLNTQVRQMRCIGDFPEIFFEKQIIFHESPYELISFSKRIFTIKIPTGNVNKFWVAKVVLDRSAANLLTVEPLQLVSAQ